MLVNISSSYNESKSQGKIAGFLSFAAAPIDRGGPHANQIVNLSPLRCRCGVSKKFPNVALLPVSCPQARTLAGAGVSKLFIENKLLNLFIPISVKYGNSRTTY